MTIADWLILAMALTIVIVAAIVFFALSRAGKQLRDAQDKARVVQNEEEVLSQQAQRNSADVFKTMQETIGVLIERQNATEEAMARARIRIAELEHMQRMQARQTNEAIDGANKLIEQLASVGVHDPIWSPDKLTKIEFTPDLVTLQDKVRQRFDIEEMNDLAMRIGLDPEELSGDTRSKRARELVNAAERRGLIKKLSAALLELRPTANW